MAEPTSDMGISRSCKMIEKHPMSVLLKKKDRMMMGRLNAANDRREAGAS